MQQAPEEIHKGFVHGVRGGSTKTGHIWTREERGDQMWVSTFHDKVQRFLFKALSNTTEKAMMS